MFTIRNRQHLKDKFSTYLRLEERNERVVASWISDRKLHDNIKKMILCDQEASENYWAIFWVKNALSSSPHPLAKWHIYAYLEETCYWTSLKICQKFVAYNPNLEDCISLARELTIDPSKLFGTKYNPSRSQVKTFASIILRSHLLEHLRRGREIDKYSDWALMRSLNLTSVEKVLKYVGIEQIAPYKLAWRCFKEIYTPNQPSNSRQLKPPTTEIWTAIAYRYNQLRSSFNLEEEINVSQVRKLLENLVDAVRQQTISKITSFEEIVENSGDIFASPITEDLESEWNRVNSILSEVFYSSSFPNNIRAVLILWKGLDFNQTEVGSVYAWTQPYVAQKVRIWRRFLFNNLVEKLSINTESQLTISDLDNQAKHIDIWIKYHCKFKYCQFLETIVTQNYNRDYFQILELFYGRNLPKEEISSRLNISESEIEVNLVQIELSFKDYLKNYLQDSFNISFSLLPSADKRLLHFVREFLVNAAYIH